MDVLNVLNTVFWVGGNVLLLYISVALTLYVLAYFAIFDPRATTGGKLIFQFMLSLLGVIVLVFIGIFIDPAPDRGAFVYPPDVEPWRPFARFLIYGFVAYSITMLGILLVKRKWFPSKLKKASDLTLVTPRTDTNEIPTITKHS